MIAWAFLFANFPLCRTRSEDSADRIGRKSLTHVLRQESEGEVTQGETASFDRSDRVLPGPLLNFDSQAEENLCELVPNEMREVLTGKLEDPNLISTTF